MTSTNTNLKQVLQAFAEQYTQAYIKEHGHLPTIEHDEQWLSPCEQEKLDSTTSYWQPVAFAKSVDAQVEQDSLSFDNVESALKLTLHPDIKRYFTTIFSEALDACCEEGQLTLLFAWNQDDFQRLQENIIGHILMKKRLKQSETVFFAVTDEEDIIVSVDNASGEVWVERVGCKPHKKLSDSLADFINQLTVKVS